MASRNNRRKTPPQQPGQQLISSYFGTPKNISAVRGVENARESSRFGESSQTSRLESTTIAKPTSASGSNKNNGASLTKKPSKGTKKSAESGCIEKFSKLSAQIMQNIFCQLPIVDLMSNCVLVCRQWHSIISNDSFIPWKKKYFRLKNRDSSSEDEMIKLLSEKGLLDVDSFPMNLASFMKDFRSCNDLSENELQCLKKHNSFQCIVQFLEAPSSSSKDQGTSPWSVVALLVWSSKTDYEVYHLMHYMSRYTSCLVYDILECYYCLASIFYLLESRYTSSTPTRHHFRVYFSLYLYEDITSGLQLTCEQAHIVLQEVKSGELMKIVAFAGTGKTTTLVEYTKRRPKKQFLNLAYNKSVQEHADKTFPKNVESRTIHSLAYESVGKRYNFHNVTSELRVNSIMDALVSDCGYLHAKRVGDTLKNFIASADSTLSLEHVPNVSSEVIEKLVERTSDDVRAIFGKEDPNTVSLNSTKRKKRIVSEAEGLWERMKDETDDFKITYDGYLKVYQLSKPDLDQYHCILVDEAQDCTPAASDIFLRQTCAKILVGDPHQQIYAFRGARNVLQEVASTRTFYLTQSFRFGPRIADVASRLLSNLKGVQDHTLVGVAKRATEQDEESAHACVITRCNSTLFDEAAKACLKDDDTKVGFVGGVRGLALDRVLDIHKLYKNRPSSDIKDPFIRTFRSFSALQRYAKVAPDQELLSRIKIVEAHTVTLEHKIERIKSKAVKGRQKADITFTTAHKAKGREFDTVRLTDDFLPATRKGEGEVKEDEKNLAYVAVTRAKKHLELSETICNVIGTQCRHIGEY